MRHACAPGHEVRGAVTGRSLTLALALACAIVATQAVAQAEELEDAFRDAVAFSPDLGVQRARLRAQRQAVPLAVSDALPRVELTGTASRVFRDDPTFRGRGDEKREDWRGSASASQLLFGSGRVLSRYRQARAQVEAAEALYGEATQSLLVETAQAYADVRRAEGFLKANEQTLVNLEAQRLYVDANLRGGFLTTTDLAQADARIAVARSGVARATADLTTAQKGFQRLVGRPPSALEALPAITTLPTSEEEALNLARDRRRIVEAARSSVAAAEAGIGAAAAEGRPRLSFEATSTIENGFDDPRESRYIDDVVGLRLVVPFSSGGANWARVRQQRALRDAAQQEEAITVKDIEQSVSVAWANLVAAQATAVSSLEEVRAAELALKGVRREQENGLRSIIDVLDQEQALLQAQLSRARAERDVAVAEYRLLFETGGLSCATCAPIDEPDTDHGRLFGWLPRPFKD